MGEPKWRRSGKIRITGSRWRTSAPFSPGSAGARAVGRRRGARQVFDHARAAHLVVVLAVGLGLLAAVLSALAYFRWRGNEIAMRQHRRLPGTFALSLVAAAVLVVAAAIAALMVIS